jgi:phytoene dehydrogenase-like protein
MKILVVGAGISGSLAAVMAAEAGHEVKLLEMGVAPGGVLRDHDHERGRWFRNCQYMNLGPWYEAAATLGGMEFDVFPHHYGSWNDLFGDVVVHDDFAQVVVPHHRAELLEGAASFGSAAARLACYPPDVARPVAQWGSRWGNLESLDHQNCLMMQLGRVFMVDDLAGVLACKKNSALADALYGVPRSRLTPPAPVQPAALPRGGWTAAFDRMMEELQSRGARLYFGAPAKASLREGRIVVSTQQGELPADLVVWCANPHPLVRAFGIERLDSPASSMVNVLFEVHGELPEAPMYWQIFARSSPVVRLFSYVLSGRQCLTVEAFDVGSDLESITRDVLRFTGDLGLNVDLKPVAVVPERRYVLLTNGDRERFARLDEQAAAAGVVTGGWHAYGRDQRLAHILGAMKQRGAL